MTTLIPRNFYFYWTGQDFQYVNYLCVLSLKKTNRVDGIYIYYEEKPEHNVHWERLNDLEKVHFFPVDFDQLGYQCGIGSKQMAQFLELAQPVHRSDLFRYLITYLQGGVYIDFDCLILKDLEPLLYPQFFAAFQYSVPGDEINGAVLAGEKGFPLMREILNELIRYAENKIYLGWDASGPTILTRVISSKIFLYRCEVEILKILRRFRMLFPGISLLIKYINKKCTSDIIIFPPTYFYHYPYTDWQAIFHERTLPSDVYILHLWSKMSREFTRRIDEQFIQNDDSLYAKNVRMMMSNK
jgi:hypothetical protein